jgi:hypothetical protein
MRGPRLRGHSRGGPRRQQQLERGGAQRDRPPDRADEDLPAWQAEATDRTDHESRVSFSDVARAHYDWDAPAIRGAAEKARTEFENALRRFEGTVDARKDVQARVVDSYWCRKQASGVALVEVSSSKDPGPLHRIAKSLRLWHPIPEYRVYRESDWVTPEFPKLATLLHECDVLAIKARWGLEGLHQAVVMPWLMTVEAHILGFIERDWQRREEQDRWAATMLIAPEKVERETMAERQLREQKEKEREALDAATADSFYHDVLRELNRIENYYQAAGEKRARVHFVSGMLIFGVLLVAVAACASAGVLALFGLLHLDHPGVRRFYASMGAGAVGAIVSVLMRMGRHGGADFAIDHELGAAGVRRLGAYRPLVGAVSGVIVALLVQTTLVPTKTASPAIAFYIVIAFLAGFSERWTRIVLEGAMRTVAKDDESDDTQSKPPATPTGRARSS